MWWDIYLVLRFIYKGRYIYLYLHTIAMMVIYHSNLYLLKDQIYIWVNIQCKESRDIIKLTIIIRSGPAVIWLRHTVMSRDTVPRHPRVCWCQVYLVNSFSPPWLRTSRSRCRTTTGRETKHGRWKREQCGLCEREYLFIYLLLSFPLIIRFLMLKKQIMVLIKL